MALKKRLSSGQKNYFIRPQGKGDFKVYQLVNARTFDIADAFFQTPAAAREYAKKRGINIVFRARS